MQTRLWILGLLIFCLLSQAARCQVSTEERERQVAELLHFDETGKIQDPEIKRAAGIQLDTFAAYLPGQTDIRIGMGLVVGRWKKLRATAQIANGGVGGGLALTIIPVIDLSVGVGALYDVHDARVDPTVYVSIYKW